MSSAQPSRRSRSLALAVTLAACASQSALDRASDAYTAAYVAWSEAAQGQADLDRLDRLEACWQILYAVARETPGGRSRDAALGLLADLLRDPDAVLAGPCLLLAGPP